MTSGHDFFEQLKLRISSGDERGALDALRQFTKERNSRYHNETLQQLARLNQLEYSERLGEMTREETRVLSAQLRRSWLALVDAVKASFQHDALPPPTTDIRFAEPPEQTGLEKIIGANNLKSIAWLQQGLVVARSVCRVVTPETLGTGFLLAGGRVMTNHHVISNAGVAAKSYVEFNVEEDLDGRLTTPCRFPIDGTDVRVDAQLDCCLVRLVEPPHASPLADWGFLQIDSTRVPAVGEHVTIIQHPAGGTKQIAITANQVVNVYEHRLQYSTDTMPGSSGSPVFNDHWRVVALHRRGGNIVTNARGETMYANEGVLMRDLVARMRL